MSVHHGVFSEAYWYHEKQGKIPDWEKLKTCNNKIQIINLDWIMAQKNYTKHNGKLDLTG